MNFKTLLNGAILFTGLGLAAYSQLEGGNVSSNIPSTVVPVTPERKFERWNLKEGSIYDGDTLSYVNSIT